MAVGPSKNSSRTRTISSRIRHRTHTRMRDRTWWMRHLWLLTTMPMLRPNTTTIQWDLPQVMIRINSN